MKLVNDKKSHEVQQNKVPSFIPSFKLYILSVIIGNIYP